MTAARKDNIPAAVQEKQSSSLIVFSFDYLGCIFQAYQLRFLRVFSKENGLETIIFLYRKNCTLQDWILPINKSTKGQVKNPKFFEILNEKGVLDLSPKK